MSSRWPNVADFPVKQVSVAGASSIEDLQGHQAPFQGHWSPQGFCIINLNQPFNIWSPTLIIPSEVMGKA